VSEGRSSKYLVGGGTTVLVIVAGMLWQEFYAPGNLGWNIFLGLFLAGLAVAAFLLQRFFLTHSAEIGEARFNTMERDR
jgi:hypothetical protein